MDEIVEGTVGTLHILARETQSRNSIRALKCMPLFVQVRLMTLLRYGITCSMPSLSEQGKVMFQKWFCCMPCLNSMYSY